MALRPPPPRVPPPTLVVYDGRDALSVQGAVTGRPYCFSAAQPLQIVDAVDAPPLLQTGTFRLAGR